MQNSRPLGAAGSLHIVCFFIFPRRAYRVALNSSTSLAQVLAPTTPSILRP